MNILGNKIKEFRALRDWTQNELAKRSGVNRGYLASIETGKVKKPSAETFLKLARAFNIRLEELYQAAGYINDARASYQPNETPEDILERLKLAQPVSIPVYTQYPVHAGEPIEPVEYIYISKRQAARRNIAALRVEGECLKPVICNGDLVVIDSDASLDIGDIVVCLISGQMHMGRLKEVGGELWIENNQCTEKYENASMAAPVIEVIRRLK